MDDRPIGIFDSGIGGLSVLREVHHRLPGENLIYFADQAHLPYGRRSLDDIRSYALEITRFLLELECKLIIVACNSASAAALAALRETYSHTLFVGMEPAVKPAAEATRTGVIGVLATPVTFQGDLFASVMARFAADVRVLQETPVGLVDHIERGEIDHPATRRILETAVKPFQQEKVDTIVLGCTHYPFIIPQLRSIIGPDVAIIDPAPAISRQVQRLLNQHNLSGKAQEIGSRTYISSLDGAALADQVERLLGERTEARTARWSGKRLDSAT